MPLRGDKFCDSKTSSERMATFHPQCPKISDSPPFEWFVPPKLIDGGLWTIFLGSKAFLDISDVNVRKNSHVCWLVGGCEVERIEGSKRKATQSYNDILVGGIPTPLKNMSSSVGIMRFPIYGKIKNVPNHQPVWPPGPADSIPFLHCFTHLKKRPRLAFTVPLPEVPLEWDWRPRQLLLSPAQLTCSLQTYIISF